MKPVTHALAFALSHLMGTLGLFMAPALCAQEPPALFFREDWKEIPASLPVTQDHVANPRLLLALYGPAKAQVKKSHHDQPADDPYYIWSGECNETWVLTFRDKTAMVNLGGLAKIRWRSFQSGFRQLRIVVKLPDGSWLVSDESDGPSASWHEREFNVADLHWHGLDIDKVVEGERVDHPDLTRVDEIGFTDLMRGGGSNASSRVDWIEVYGKAMPRP